MELNMSPEQGCFQKMDSFFDFTIRRWIETGDIHLVSKEIGHSSVTMTQKYADFNLRRLMADFPSLNNIIESRLSKTVSNESLLALGSNYLQFG